MDIKNSASQIVQYVGGVDNIQSLTHCATRLRFVVKDEAKVDMDHLGSVEGVLTAQNKGGQTQVVIGAKVEAFYKEITSSYKIAAGGEVEDDGSPKKKQNPITLIAT